MIRSPCLHFAALLRPLTRSFLRCVACFTPFCTLCRANVRYTTVVWRGHCLYGAARRACAAPHAPGVKKVCKRLDNFAKKLGGGRLLGCFRPLFVPTCTQVFHTPSHTCDSPLHSLSRRWKASGKHVHSWAKIIYGLNNSLPHSLTHSRARSAPLRCSLAQSLQQSPAPQLFCKIVKPFAYLFHARSVRRGARTACRAL